MRRAFEHGLGGLALLALVHCAKASPGMGAAPDRGAEAGAGAAQAQAHAAAGTSGSAGAGRVAQAAGAGAAGAGAAADSGSNDAGAADPIDAATEAADDAGQATPPSVDPGCLGGITGYAAQGPFRYTPQTSGSLKLWVPQLPAGCKVPIVHFANGTAATCENYRPALERLASHGFLSVCFESTATGNGNAGLEAFEAVLQRYADLADQKLGSAGHDQGGQGALVTLQLAEAKWGDSMLYAGLAAQPSTGNGSYPEWKAAFAQVNSPTLIFSGSADMLVSEAWVEQSYEALRDTVEAYLWSAVGATHVPVPIDAINQVSVAWFRWKLLGDQSACKYLSELPDSATWDRRKQQNVRACM